MPREMQSPSQPSSSVSLLAGPASPSVSVSPLVTVIAVCYNHERFLLNCLESIRGQNYSNLQILLLDDCSKDASAKLIRNWIALHPSLPVTFVANEQNRGLCRTLNCALGLARGKYISMTATDDAWEPGKIAGQVRVMESLPEQVGVLYSDAFQMDESGALLPKRFIESYRHFDRMPEGGIHDLLWEGNFIPAMATMIRRSVFETVGSYDENLFYEDWEMWLRISEHYDFAYYPTPTARYRIVRTSMSKSAVDRMTLANELIFIKYLTQGSVPRAVRSKAFNYAVSRVFREKEVAYEAGLATLRTISRRYSSPRLLCALLLYHCGLEYKHYDAVLRWAKKVTASVWNKSKHLPTGCT